MALTKEQKKFLKDMYINESDFVELGRDVQILIDIAADYELHKNDLLDEAGYIANKLQRCKGVHSVRSRIKDTSHLIEKIIRKWSDETVADKYNVISKENYKSTITDLVGVRAIYLFKSDWKTVCDHILSKWEPKEDVIIYHREGDDLSLYEQHDTCKKEVHFSGYRSIHYVVPATKINGEQVFCEIQTRTIFEEGWSEIDHKVRYPSFSDDPHLQEYLDLFNRMAGNVDQMGSYVGSLVKLIQYKQSMGDLAKELAKVHDQEISKLEIELDQLIEKKAEHSEIKKVRDQLKAKYDIQKKLLIENNLLVETTLKQESEILVTGAVGSISNKGLEETIARLFGFNVEIMKNEELLKAAQAAANFSASINQNEDLKKLASAALGFNKNVTLATGSIEPIDKKSHKNHDKKVLVLNRPDWIK